MNQLTSHQTKPAQTLFLSLSRGEHILRDLDITNASLCGAHLHPPKRYADTS